MTKALAERESLLRFGFGENWQQFLNLITEERIVQAEASLVQMLDMPSLKGQRFLDIGSGSGLFSLAARRLGAEVCSFDFDAASVACTEELKRRHFPGDERWQISRGSVLDADFISSLGMFDIVYSWGVLHHTGALWQAMENAASAAAEGGRLLVAIYNDQGSQSLWWSRVKRTYNQLPKVARVPYLLAFGVILEGAALTLSILRLKPQRFAQRWTTYESARGMSRWHDIVDWIGGYPFEVATPEAIFDFCRLRGFALLRLKTCGGRMGCNEFVFIRDR